MSDPIEAIVSAALREAGVRHRLGMRDQHRLDFHLIDFNVAIEVKQFHSGRISEQMSRHPDVIAIQGRKAAEAFAKMLKPGYAEKNNDTR